MPSIRENRALFGSSWKLFFENILFRELFLKITFWTENCSSLKKSIVLLCYMWFSTHPGHERETCLRSNIGSESHTVVNYYSTIILTNDKHFLSDSCSFCTLDSWFYQKMCKRQHQVEPLRTILQETVPTWCMFFEPFPFQIQSTYQVPSLFQILSPHQVISGNPKALEQLSYTECVLLENCQPET